MQFVCLHFMIGCLLCCTAFAVDVGDIRVTAGNKLRSTVFLSDGKTIPDGMRVSLSSDRTTNVQTAMLDSDGAFEFSGLAAGVYLLVPAVKGYRLQVKC